MKDIMVSIAVITYGHEKYIRNALDSILTQNTEYNYEILIGEDNSPDNTREILLEYKEKYPEIIQLVLRDVNIGATKNICDLWRKARGKYIATLEGDDYWIDNLKLQKTIDFLEQNTSYLAVSHRIEERTLDNKVIAQHPEIALTGKEFTIEEFLKGNYYSAVATVFRNFVIESPSSIDIVEYAHWLVGDYTICMILLDKGKVFVLNDIMSVYRSRSKAGEQNYNSITDSIKQYKDHLEVVNANNLYYKGKYDFSLEYINKSILAFINSIKSKQIKDFFELFNTIPKKCRFLFWGYLSKRVLRKSFRVLFLKNQVNK
ncbi:glycosyltransferase family 2 protein [Alloiococcus sp. CFN-8]|uniref:glycosyltransferase family 2 protein n=1 Tax=Alloiococcus sp. CFN-8 TaxID=3416081 RepID=UPI003CEF1C81